MGIPGLISDQHGIDYKLMKNDVSRDQWVDLHTKHGRKKNLNFIFCSSYARKFARYKMHLVLYAKMQVGRDVSVNIEQLSTWSVKLRIILRLINTIYKLRN